MMKRIAGLALALTLLALGGCGGNPQVTGASVSGTVKYKGKVVTGGEIQFVAPGDPNKSTSGMINGDGTFDVPNVPVGEMKVLVDTEMARYDVRSMNTKGNVGDKNPNAKVDAGPPRVFMQIDKKYAKLDTTTLGLTVAKGKNQKDFEMD